MAQPEGGSDALACHLPLQLLLASLPACNTISTFLRNVSVKPTRNALQLPHHVFKSVVYGSLLPNTVYEGTTATAQT